MLFSINSTLIWGAIFSWFEGRLKIGSTGRKRENWMQNESLHLSNKSRPSRCYLQLVCWWTWGGEVMIRACVRLSPSHIPSNIVISLTHWAQKWENSKAWVNAISSEGEVHAVSAETLKINRSVRAEKKIKSEIVRKASCSLAVSRKNSHYFISVVNSVAQITKNTSLILLGV